MKPRLVRSPAELKEARQALRLSADGLASMVRMGDGRTVRRWEAGENEIPGPVTVILETAIEYLRQQEEIDMQLRLLQEGRMRSGSTRANGVREDTTAADIARLIEAKRSYEQALTILTRRPLDDGAQPVAVHWYNLKRLTPRHIPGEEDSWSIPGETSPEGALAYFAKGIRLENGLRICAEDDPDAEFRLEKRRVLRRQYGAVTGLQAGELVEESFVRAV